MPARSAPNSTNSKPRRAPIASPCSACSPTSTSASRHCRAPKPCWPGCRAAMLRAEERRVGQGTRAALAPVDASALGAELHELEAPARADCLALLSLLADLDLGELALPRAEALLARLPDSHA